MHSRPLKPTPDAVAAKPPIRRSADAATAALLLAAVAFLLLIRVGEAPISRRAELRTYTVASEMAAGGDWLVPHMNGEPRLEKPPLYYWSAAAAMRMGGGADTFELRLPSLVAAVLLLAVTYFYGRSIGGPALGLGAVTALGTTYLFLRFGRRGVADMPLAVFTTAALFEYHRLRFRGEGHRWALAAYLVLAFLAKATAAWLVVFLPIFGFETVEKRRRARQTKSGTPPPPIPPREPVFTAGWIAVVALGCASWYAAVALTLPGAVDAFREALLVPTGLAGESDAARHHQPVWWFVPQFLRVAMPATLLLPLLVSRAWRTRLWRHEPEMRFVAVVFLATFVAFSLLPQKQRHYLLPSMPFFAILVARCALASAAARPEGTWRLFRTAGLPIAVAGSLFSIFAFFYLLEIEQSPVPLASAVAIAGVVASIAFARSVLARLPRTLLIGAVALTVLPYSLFVGSLAVWQGRFRSGEITETEEFDAARWRRVFDRYPFAVEPFRAEDWLEGERTRFEREALDG